MEWNRTAKVEGGNLYYINNINIKLMKNLESLNSKKFEKMQSSKINDLAAILGGTKDVLTGRQQLADWSYDEGGSDNCWTTVASGDSKETKGGDCI